MTIEEKEKHFQTEHFMDWKVKEETKANSHYIQLCAPQLYGENEHYYFYCNRSGQYIAKGKGKRQIKTQDTSKAGSTCTAHIKAVKTLTTGKITAHYCSTHSNHSISLGHLRISAITKEKIALKLIEGVAAERILDDMRDSITVTVTRELLINKQDIHNIKLKHNTEGIIRHKDDSKSVHAWTEEMKSLPYNSIPLYIQSARNT